ncbi:hypothetical protein V502_09753 [Pseudogymnoascus sp. VKM F-4520 (FW-2644)]|nr:hypothetical protein V502_09753 [Pseudogymnoascus sp. VKM F-4520 (FW-2644)]
MPADPIPAIDLPSIRATEDGAEPDTMLPISNMTIEPMGNLVPTRACTKIAMQAQQTKIASLSPVGRSHGSDDGPGTEASSEPLFCSGVPDEPPFNVSVAIASVVLGGLATSEETLVQIEPG